MGCDCCKSSGKLEKLFTFLGIHLCYECGGSGRTRARLERDCSCCERETTTCPECKGAEFLVEEDSMLRSLIDTNSDDEFSGVGLCD